MGERIEMMIRKAVPQDLDALIALIVLLVLQLLIGAVASQDRHVRARSAHTREVVLRG